MKKLCAFLLISLAACNNDKMASTSTPTTSSATASTESTAAQPMLVDTSPAAMVQPRRPFNDTLPSLQSKEAMFFYKSPNKKVYQVTVVPDENMSTNMAINCNDVKFAGRDRKAAKISIAFAPVLTRSLDSFIKSLKSDSFMKSQNISKDSGSNRVSFEKKNALLTNIFLYAVKRESDNDYHMIIGNKAGTLFFNTEISGIPPANSSAFAKLKAVRQLLEARFGVLCDPSYRKFTPGIPIELTGSAFFDVDHDGGTVGPAGMRPKTAWELHPATNLLFK